MMVVKTHLSSAGCLTMLLTAVHALQCAFNASDKALLMMESNIARGEGKADSGALLGQIELGIFQQALRESIEFTNDLPQKTRWKAYLQDSVLSTNASLSVTRTDAGYPLDRLSIGTSMIYQDRTSRSTNFSADVIALKESVIIQERNANGGLWYYDNVHNLSAYHNLSYLDGMYSYPSFALLAGQHSKRDSNAFGLSAVFRQLQILYNTCKTTSGLLVHGYDASKAHAWANSKTGASPVVWARSLSWYTVGLLNALEISHLRPTKDYARLKQIFINVVQAQVTAAERSRSSQGNYGVWQVVDRPGATFSGHRNYVEASASCMTVYALLRAVRLGFLEHKSLQQHALSVAVGLYKNILYQFLIENDNGTLSLSGTSDIASLSGNVNYEVWWQDSQEEMQDR